MKDWIDEHVDATVQHTVLCAAIFAGVWWLFTVIPLTPAAIGMIGALGVNTAREVRDAQKGSGFGWKTLLIPNTLCIAAYLVTIL